MAVLNSNHEPAYSSVCFFERGISTHSAVDEFRKIEQYEYSIKRLGGKSDISFIVVDIYIAGEADIYEILSENPDIDAIVLIGFYNRYSSIAKKEAATRGVGLFTRNEFFGALNLQGNAFLNYGIPKED